jgi:hypothetical protein
MIKEVMKQEQNAPKCKTHPDAPHGFVRNASHSEDRYVCECEFWEPPEQDEPVAWFREENGEKIYYETKAWDDCLALYTKPQPKQEQGDPVAWSDLLKDAQQIVKDKFLYKRFIDGTPLANDIPCWMADFAQQYTTPQIKKWAGLTKEDKYSIYIQCTDVSSEPNWEDFANAVEAKLKERNT